MQCNKNAHRLLDSSVAASVLNCPLEDTLAGDLTVPTISSVVRPAAPAHWYPCPIYALHYLQWDASIQLVAI